MPDQRDDALFSADVDVSQVIEGLEAIEEQLSRLVDIGDAQLTLLEDSVESVGRQAGEVASSQTDGIPAMSASMVALGNIAANVFQSILASLQQVIASTKDYIFQAVELSRHVEMQKAILMTLAEAQGYTNDQMEDYIQGMRETGITTRATIQVLNLMVEQQLDLTKAVEIATVAQNRGRIAGLNSSETTERILFAITNLNTRMLQSIGIHVRTEKAYDDYARAAGKASGAALTFEEKQKALTLAIIEYGEKGAGAYKAASETIGGALLSYPRAVEEIQLAVGKAFQPLADVFTQEKIDFVVALGTYLEENSDKVKAFGEVLAQAGESFFDVVDAIKELLGLLPDLLDRVGDLEVKLGKVGETGEREGVRIGRVMGIGVTFVTAAVLAMITSIGEGIKFVAKDVDLLFKLLTGKITAAELFREQSKVAKESFEKIKTTFADTATAMAHLTGIAEDVGDEMKDQSDDVRDAGQSWDEYKEAARAADEALIALRLSMGRRMQDLLRSQARQRIDDEIKESRYREDLAIATARRLEDIERNAAEARADILEDHDKERAKFEEDAADARIEIEKDRQEEILDLEEEFRRELLQIEEDFERAAREASIRNDAIAFLQAKRAMDDQIEDANRRREEETDDIGDEYSKRSQELEDSLDKQRRELEESQREQLAALDDSLRKQEEAFALSQQRQEEDHQLALKRQEEDRALSLQRQEEDYDISLQRQLEDMRAKYGDMVDTTVDALKSQTQEYMDTYGPNGSVDNIMNDFFKRQQEWYRKLEFGGYTGGEEEYGAYGIGPGSDRGGRMFGQAGLVSTILAEGQSRIVSIPMAPVAPSIPTGLGRGESSQTLNFNFQGVEPYLQRVAVTAATEVYRNMLAGVR